VRTLAPMRAAVVTNGELRVEQNAEEPSSSCSLGAHDVLLDVLAVALNWRDVAVQRAARSPYVPCSDCCARVRAVGARVTRVQPGDRVVALFCPAWVSREPCRPEPAAAPPSLLFRADACIAPTLQANVDPSRSQPCP
jgi:NADPH:quinone reductase-like Zn-dependent oxidoreductase